MRQVAIVAGLAALLAAAGCAGGPAGGASGTAALRATPAAMRADAAEGARLVARYGGPIAAPALSRYVSDLGALVVRAGAPGDEAVRFTVLDSPEVNAFARPDGRIYVTRGLIELASDESELAAVFAHELGHEEADRGMSAVRTLVESDRDAAPVAIEAARAEGPRPSATASAFSRDEEFAADARGIQILAAAGFDPHAMARFLAKLRARARLEAVLRGEPPDALDRTGFLADHPATIKRLERARRLAARIALDHPMNGRDAYLSRIDGLAYGDSPGQGVIRGRRLADAALRVAFEVPEGFRLFNAPDSVVAYGPGGARIVFDRARDPDGLAPERYLAEVWGGKIALQGVEPLAVHGTRGATALAHGTTAAGPVDVRLVVLTAGDGTLFRLVYISPRGEAAALAPALRRTTESFTRLSAEEARRIRPLRLRVVTVGPGDTVESLAGRMAFSDFRRERFDVLNGLGPDAQLATGMRVKIVSE